jgi:hypothetical protein
MMAQIKELQNSSAKESQPADITDDPIVAPHRISLKQYVLFESPDRRSFGQRENIRPRKHGDLVRYSRTTYADALCCTTRMRSHSRTPDWIPRKSMTQSEWSRGADQRRCGDAFVFAVVRRCVFCRTGLARCSHFEAGGHGVGQKGAL